MKKTASSICVLMLVAGSFPALEAEELPDPRERDEDISATQVGVQVSRTVEGLFEYLYAVSAPELNSGSVNRLKIDISCPEGVEQVGLPEQPTHRSFLGSGSKDNLHAPVVIAAAPKTARAYYITEANAVTWTVNVGPGRSVEGLRLISTMPPVPREYDVEPFMDTAGWNYAAFDEDDPTVPWIGDFTVVGVIEGPGCSHEELPPDDGLRFAGSLARDQDAEANQLLTYSQPLKDKLHLAPGERSLTFTIHYSDDINPKSFRVQPAASGWQRLFNPQPGTQETVTLNLDDGRNRIEFFVQARFDPPGRTKDPKEQAAAPPHTGPHHDRDVFKVRVSPMSAAPGGGRGKDGGK